MCYLEPDREPTDAELDECLGGRPVEAWPGDLNEVDFFAALATPEELAQDAYYEVEDAYAKHLAARRAALPVDVACHLCGRQTAATACVEYEELGAWLCAACFATEVLQAEGQS